MTMYEEALAFTTEKHEGQTRWDGRDYIEHLIRVADQFKDDERKTVAILHDAVEDGKATLKEIGDLFGDLIAEAVDAISKKEGEPYNVFVFRAEKNPIAKDVKIADIKDNIGDFPSENTDHMRKASSLITKRYIPAFLFLCGMNEDYGKKASRDSFSRHLERASKAVEKWPDWKKKAAGVYKYSTPPEKKNTE